jgi:beta-lactamase class A
MKLALRIRCVLAIFLMALALGCGSPAPAQDSQTDPARASSGRADVEKLIQQSGADVSVAFRSLDGTRELFIQADKQFEDATAMKIPVMIELYAQVDAREVRWSDPLQVHTSFRSIVDGSMYGLDPAAAGDIARSAGKTMTLRQLCDAMIAGDSDLAANLLIEKLGIDRIHRRMHALGADGMELVAGFGDNKALAQGLKNVTSARALMVVLWALAENQVVGEDASKQMIGLIAHSGLEGGTPGITPARAPARRVSLGGDQYDATIIIGAHSFVLVTDVRGLADRRASAALVAQIAHALSAAM